MPRAKHHFAAALAALVVMLCLSSARAQYPFSTTPLFQYAIFYNLNLEVDPGTTFPVLGPVFSNAGIWSGTGNITYYSTVEAIGKVSTNGSDPFCTSKSDTGTPSSSFQYPGQPISGLVPVTFSGANNLTGAETFINLPPGPIRAPQTLAYFVTNQIYAFNAASLIVSNWYYGTNGVAPWSNNFTVYLQDSVIDPAFVQSNGVPMNWIQLTNDFYIFSNSVGGVSRLLATNYVPDFKFTNNASAIRWTNSPAGTNTVWYAGFSFLTNASFYDFRENAQVQAVQLDVGKLGAWITNCTPNAGSNWNQELFEDNGHGIDSIFINNTVPFIGQQQLPAVRLVDGQLLPSSTLYPFGPSGPITSGLTVVTPQPLYVLGDYNVQTNAGPIITGSHNTLNTYPAALMADAITILSSAWADETASASGQSYVARPASNTTVNAACYTGIVPSVGSFYSGGVENYFRLLENWDGDTFTYNGSMAAMFSSIYATNPWAAPSGSLSYYGVPTRSWAYDTNYNLLSGLPPLTPVIVNSNAAPAITVQPTNETVLTKQTTNFIVSASGIPAISYQWLFKGANISWGTNASLVLTNIQLTNAGNYSVQISNALGAVTSSNATLSVYTSAVPVMNGMSFSAANGLQFNVSGVPGFNYAVLASTNLIDWTSLTTNNSPFNFADTNAGYPYRFYRSVYLP